MKKFLILVAVFAVFACGVALAGLDMYAGKHYTTIVKPSAIGVNSSGTTAAVSNTPVSLVSYPGIGALALSVNCGDSGVGVVAARIYYTTNIGTLVSWTNGTPTAATSQDVNSWAFTNVQTNVIARFNPGAMEGRVQVLFTATAVTNGSVGAVAVTE